VNERCRFAANEIEILRDERDEARRIACAYMTGNFRKDLVTLNRKEAIAEADRRGWGGCFKEATDAK
jgi:hypothetical protein